MFALEPFYTLLNLASSGYIAGVGDGIVTVNNMPASRRVILLDAETMQIVMLNTSLKSGHYLFSGLDANKRYLVMCRDLPPNGIDQRYEPAVYDYVPPATDLTIEQQQALWKSWSK